MIRRLISATAVAAAGCALTAGGAAGAASGLDPLPAGWRADIGIPVAWNGTTVTLFGDTFHDAGLARNTVVVGDTVITDAVPASATGSVFWPGDCIAYGAGLFCVLGEIHDDPTASQAVRDLGMGFTGADSDAFIVTDPTSPMSWKLATKVEDGPWGDASVAFSDQAPIVFTRAPASFETEAWEYDPADPAAQWWPLLGANDLPVRLPDSFGTAVPVQTDDGWWVITSDDWHTHRVWHTVDIRSNDWQVDHTFTTEGRTYDHSLNVVAGQVLHRWSNGEGSGRVEYQAVTL